MKKFADWYVPDGDQYCSEFQVKRRFSLYKTQNSWIKKHIKYTNLYIDVGANFGHTAVPFKTWFKKIVAFEITPKNYECLVANAKECSNIVCYNLGLSNQHGMVNVLEYSTAGSVNTIESTKLETQSGKKRKPVIVQRPVTTLDLMFPTEIVNLMKIDVEGHEVAVVEGGKELLSRSRGVMYVETSDKEKEKLCILLNDLGWKYISRKGMTDLLFKKK